MALPGPKRKSATADSNVYVNSQLKCFADGIPLPGGAAIDLAAGEKPLSSSIPIWYLPVIRIIVHPNQLTHAVRMIIDGHVRILPRGFEKGPSDRAPDRKTRSRQARLARSRLQV